MHTPSQSSPFAALTLKEQQEQWIVWQSQHLEAHPVEPAKTALPPLHLPAKAASSAPEPKVNEPAITEPKINEPKINEPKINEPKINEPKAPLVRHSQYDAVLKRMELAGRRAGQWHTLT